MTNPTHRDPESLLIQSHRIVRGIWLAVFALVVAIWIAVPLVLTSPRPASQDGTLLAVIFYAVGLGDVALGWWMKRLALSPGRHAGARSLEEVVAGLTGPWLIAAAMAPTPAVLGLAHFTMYADRGALSVLCVLSLIALAVSWPSLDRWREILKSVSVTKQRSA
ncbi:MAG: hypothetical protein QME77_13380 [bacterium]|nr:hypothetical protein [bacterium]